MTAKIILNPYSNRWNAQKRRPEVEAALQAAGVPYEVVESQAHNHAVQLAEQAVLDGFRPIIAAGGDGTISEVVNGLQLGCQKGGLDSTQVPFGIMPLGSADDLVDNIKLPRDLQKAALVIAAGNTRPLDLCQVTCGGNTRYFDNNAAMGLEPYITLVQQKITWLHGTLRYLLATVRGVLDGPHWDVRLEWEGGNYRGPVSLVTIGNNPRTGGLFFVTPHALPTDGLLTFVYGYMPTRLQILALLPRTMKPAAGNYVEHPAIHEVNSPWLRIHSDQPTPLHADGEIQSEVAQDMEFRVLPGKLSVLMPAAPTESD